ncbi:MAG: hypothetical protein ACOCT9_01430 [archaeon]
MKIEDIIDKMSKSFLERIVKSFTNEIYTKDEKGYRNQISSNIDFLSNTEKIKERLSKYIKDSKNPYFNGLLVNFILKTLLSKNQYKASQEEIIENIQKSEQEIIQKSKSQENLKHIDDKSMEIFETILAVALEDNIITDDELNLINKVRKKLSIQEKDQYLIQAKLNKFPQKNNVIHEPSQINQGLNDLQKCGIIFYCNKLDEPIFVLPDELIEGVKSYLGVELIEDKFNDLLEILTKNELSQILDDLQLLQSGTKEDLINRVLMTGIKPSEVLDSLTTTRLTEICKKLPDVKSSGTKEEKISQIIKYFDELVNIDIGQSEDKREVYYKFFEQLAKKDMANLIGKKIVKHERDVELAFERATNYLFEKKLNHQVIKQEGTEHSDGCIKFRKNGELLMWDNKTKMQDKYKFPNSHLKQFKRYIRDANNKGKRVSCFLVIVPEFDEKANENAERLKYESGIDTDVAIISAENLKWIAEEWSKNKKEESFNLQVFNKTGLLTKDVLKSRIKLFS